jgi:dolichol kinase/phosphoserine phosphatase
VKYQLTTPSKNKPKLVVFDVEGVLIPRNRVFFDIGKSMGVLALLKILFFGFLYEIGVSSLKPLLKRVFIVMRGVKIDFFIQTLKGLPLMPDTKKVFTTLKSNGCKTALISSGLPTFLVKKLADSVGADYAVGVEVGVKKNALTGEIWGDTIESKGKLKVLKTLIDSQGIKLSECAVVADDRNNASIFLKEILKIGYNPDFIIRIKADAVVNGKLTKILPAINGEKTAKTKPSTKDFFRESIHASGFFIPLIALLFGITFVVLLICSIVAVYTFSEYVRIRGKNMPIISTITHYAASQSELCDLTRAPLYFAFGILLTLIFFPAPASSAAIAIFALGDSTASLVGEAFARNHLPFNRGKSLEGSLAGFFFAFLAGTVFVTPWIALIGATVAMTIEYLPLPINDNLLMPLCTGLALTLII